MHCSFPRTLTIWSVLPFLLVLFAVPGPAGAERGVLTPSITATTTYDDNVHFKKHSDIELVLTPALNMHYGQEDWDLASGVSADIYRYKDLDVFDRENYKLWVGGSKELTETLEVTCRGTFDYDHTFVSELTESGSVTAQALRRRYSLSPGASWQMTERDTLSLTLPYNDTKYTGSDNADSISLGAVGNWSHVLSNERAVLLGQFGYTNYYFDRTDGDTNQDVYTLLGGMRYQFSELFNVTGHIGLGHARSKVAFNTLKDVSAAETYFSFDLSGTYQREKWKVTVGADRQASPSTDGEVTVRTRGNVEASYSFTERLSAALKTAYYHTKSGGLISESKSRAYYLQPSMTYSLSENSSLRLEFRHLNTKNLITDLVRKQNRTALRFEYRYPWFF